MTTTRSILVWDQKHDPPLSHEAVLCWQSYAQRDAVVSVPRYLEVHADRIRRKYLAFIHDLAEHRVAGTRVVEHLDLGDGFSLWWMTLLAEKSPLKSPRIYDCLRLIALEEMVLESRPSLLTLVSADRALAQATRRLCENLKIEFRYRMPLGVAQKWSTRRIYDALPGTLKGLLSLRHVARRWRLWKLRKPEWFGGENAIFICSYFIHLDLRLCAQGQFRSRQWEDLPKVVHDGGKRINWIQHFLFSATVPTVKTGISWLRGFNDDARNQGYHAFLDSYLTLRAGVGALKNWLWLIAVSWRLRKFDSAFTLNESAVWLWPLLRSDWQSSLTGPVAVSNCLWIALFDAALSDMPRQGLGFYLCENQNWEKALLRAWRRHGHGRIVGVQHSTAPFWHLYYADDPRCFNSDEAFTPPQPDQLAVNGAAARKALANTGYPVEKLVEVEALRYLNLAGVVGRHTIASARRVSENSPGSRVPAIKVLILGDMIPASMRHLLLLMEAAMERLPTGFQLTLKPHPGYSVDLTQYPRLLADETRDALGEILDAYDVAVAANSTSASIDAYLAGLSVIIALDGDELNLSPLRGQSGIRFVSTGMELAEALQSAGSATVPNNLDRDFFFLDSDLPRWKRLLYPSEFPPPGTLARS